MTLIIGRWGEYQSIIWRNSEDKAYIIVINSVSRLAFVEALNKTPSKAFNKIFKEAYEMNQPVQKLQINSEVESYKEHFKTIPYLTLKNNFHSLGIAYQFANQLKLSNSNSTRQIHDFTNKWNNDKHSKTNIEPSKVSPDNFMKIQAETYIRELRSKIKK